MLARVTAHKQFMSTGYELPHKPNIIMSLIVNCHDKNKNKYIYTASQLTVGFCG